MAFKYGLRQIVKLSLSDESGEVRGRSELVGRSNSYLVAYQSATGCMVKRWLDEDELVAPEDNKEQGK